MDTVTELSVSVVSEAELRLTRAPGKSLQNVVGVSQDWGEESAVSIRALKSATSTKTSLTVKSSAKISTIKLEEKFKKYASGGDLLLQQISRKVSEEVATFENLCDSKHLLERNTESFRCLAQVLLSSSSLAKNRLFLFPPLEDPGIALAFNFQEPPPINDDIGVEKYKRLCRELDIVPITRVIKCLETETLDLKYYGLTVKQVRALTEAMKANGRVQTLILQDNWLSVEMAQMLSDMLVENISLISLSLYECRLGQDGAQKLGEILSSLQTLKSLDLSFNELGDAGLLALKEGLCENTSLSKLNLSHNNITEDSAETMETVLMENKSIEDLDLSWNGFFTAQGNRKLFKGLTQSDRIKLLNLSWNGLGLVPAVNPMVRYLKKSQNLEELDLSNNRLEGQSLRMARTGINKNHSLRVVRIGNNCYGPDEAHFLLTMLAGKGKDPLEYLDMDNMYINKESKPVLMKIQNINKRVKLGGILSDYEIHGPNPRKSIYERCRYILMKPKKAKARKDFGHFILNLPDSAVTPEELQKELKKQKMKKLDKDLVEALANLFMNKKKQVDCPALVRDYMSFYPDTKLPPPKPKRGKAGKKGKQGKKGKEEKEIKVHDLENATAAPEEQLENQPSKKSLINKSQADVTRSFSKSQNEDGTTAETPASKSRLSNVQ